MSTRDAQSLGLPDSGPRCALGDPMFDERYRAIDARDTRFDGQFFTAVSSTGIYCRPSCPARTPKRENVAFFLTSAAAHEAGFRACKRCLPEAAPGSPEWDLRGDLVARAMRLIGDGVVDREGVTGLAERLGYTARHVNRLLAGELGARFSGDRLEGRPALPSGTAAKRPTRAPVRLELELPVRQPYDAPGVFAFLAARAVKRVEWADLTDNTRLKYARTLRLPQGPAAFEVVATRSRGHDWVVRVQLTLADVADVAPAVARVRRLLDIDADPVAIDAALSADPVLAPLVARTPGIRVPGAIDPHELVVRALVGQQISVAAARTHLSRLAEFIGTPVESGIAGLDRLFPSPAQISAGLSDPVATTSLDPARPLRLPGKAISAVIGTSHALASGELQVHVGADSAALRAALVARPRIGPWTAAYIAMRVLGDPDAWLEGDVALVAGARSLDILGDNDSKAACHRVLAGRAIAWAPWRSYASMHLWQAASTSSPRAPRPRQDRK